MNRAPLQLENVAVVVLSESNNPNLLNPDFLANNGIVPGSWKPQQVLVTPPIAMVTYENGVTISVEETKLQIAAAKPTEMDWQNELPRIAVTYLTVLKHVHYQSAGLNMVMTRPSNSNVEKDVANRMLQKGPWLDFRDGISATEVKLHYRESQPYLQISIQGGRKPGNDATEKSVFLFSANFHHEFRIDQVAERNRFINDLARYEAEFRALIDQIPLG